MRDLTCVVLGANGFIGTNLTLKLVSLGAKVRGFGRQKPNKFLKNVPWVIGNFSNPDNLELAVAGCDVVFHLIDDSVPTILNMNKPSSLLNSVSCTLDLLELCRANRVRKIVYMSSGGTVYGVSNDVPHNELSLTDPICSYGINKLAIEKYLFLYHHLYGLDYTAIRLSNPYGPYQNSIKKQGIIGRVLTNLLKSETTEIWGDGEIVRDFIYIDDVIDALIKVTNYSGPTKIFNVGSGKGRTINQVMDDIAKIIHPKQINKKYCLNRSVDVPVNVLNIDRIENEVGWKPETSWTEGLNKTIDWFLEEYK